jgi:hypothetical protein
MLQVASDPAEMIDALRNYVPPVADRWPEKRNAI